MKPIIHIPNPVLSTPAKSVRVFDKKLNQIVERMKKALIATKNPVSVMDLHATIMTAMGISPKTEFEIEGRPFYVTEDGKGKAVTEIFA